MAKKPREDLDLKGMEIERDIFKAIVKTIDLQSGKNVSSQDYSNLPRKEAIEVLDRLTNDSVLKRLCHNRYQRTNASVDLETQKHFRDGIKKVEAEITNHFNQKLQKRETRAMAYEFDPQTGKNIRNTDAPYVPFGTKASQAQRDRILAEARGIRTNINNDITTASEPEVVKVNEGQRSPSDFIAPLSGIASEAELVRFSDGRSVNLSQVSAVSSVQLQSEAGTLSSSDYSFSGLSIEAKKIGNAFAISNELLDDSPQVAEASIRSAAQAISRYLDAQFVSGSDIVSGSPIATNAGIATSSVANVAAVTLNNLTSLCASHAATEDLVLVLNEKMFSSVISELLIAAKHNVDRVGDDLFFGTHRIVFSSGIAGPSASYSGQVLAVAGSLKDGLVLAEREPLSVKKSDELLAANDQCHYFIGGRYGVAVRRPEAISKLVIA
ncbi:MAG: phage major capsid protein [Rubripirellula sp.]